VDQEVAKTLGELELKLQELERELTTIGRRDATATTPESQPSGRLIDEAVELSAAEQTLVEGDGFGGPPVFGGEEVPSQAGATIERDWTVEVRETAYGEIPTPPAAPTPPASSIPGPPIPPPAPTPQPPPTTPPGPPPPWTPPAPAPPETPPEPPQPIDRADLVRFKHKLERTMEDLFDEYSKLLLPKPPA
jgi:hypothetical protein